MRVKSKNLWYKALPGAETKKNWLKAADGQGVGPGPGFNPLKNLPPEYFDQFYPQSSTAGPSSIPPNFQGPNTSNIPLPQQGSIRDLSPAQSARRDAPQSQNTPQWPHRGMNPTSPILYGLAALDAAIPQGNIQKQNVVRPEEHQVYNQHPYGTGSQAFYTGGQIMDVNRTNPVIIPEGTEDNMPSAKDGHWIQKAINPKHKGYCTPMTKSTCTPRRKALAKTFKKHHGFHEDGGIIPDNMSNFSPHRYESGGNVNGGANVRMVGAKYPNTDLIEQWLLYEQGGPVAYAGQNVPNMLEKIVSHPNMMDMAYDGQNIPNLLEKMVMHPNQADMQGFASGGQLSADKAKEMLRDGTAHGKKLTKQQKKYFGYIAGGGKADMGDILSGDPGDPPTGPVIPKGAKNVRGATDPRLSGYDQFNNAIATGAMPRNLYGFLQGSLGTDDARKLTTAASVFSQNPEINTLSGQQRLEKFYSSQSNDPQLQGLKDKMKNYFGTNSIQSLVQTTPDINLLGNAGVINRRKLENNVFASTYEHGGTLMYDDGGQVDTMWGGNATKASDNPYDGGTMEFNGASHDNGGIGMHYNGNPVEVEGGETAAKDSQGNLNIFGNMYLPGTRTKFKTASKEISEKEKRYDFIKTKGAALVNKSNPANKYEQLAFNAGQVMMNGGDMGQKDLAAKKEKLSALQKAMLDTADQHGLDPHELSRGNVKKAKFGASLKKKAAEGDSLTPDQQDPTLADKNHNPGNIKYGKFAQKYGAKRGQAAPDGGYYAVFPDRDTGFKAMKGLLTSPSYKNMTVDQAIHKWTGGVPYHYNLGDVAGKKVSDLASHEMATVLNTMTQGEGTKYGMQNTPPTQNPIPPSRPPITVKPPDYNPYGLPPVNPFTPDQPIVPKGATPPNDQFNPPPDREPLPSNAEPLHINNVLGEIYGAATNRQIPVVAQKFIPEQYVPYQVSFQDRLNENQNSFSALSRQIGPTNPSALGALAGQKYSADSSVKADEFRTNQGISNDITNKNIALENDAQLKNLGIADTQYTRQSTAGSKTREFNQMILNSLSSKFAQNDLENKRLKAYENLYDYRFVPNERGGDTATYFGPNAAFNFNGNSAQQPGSSNDIRTVKNYDAYGNLKNYREIDDSTINDQYRALKTEMEKRKLPLLTAPKLFAGGHL